MESNAKILVAFLLILVSPLVTSDVQGGITDVSMKVCVDPKELNVKVGDVFDVHINACDVVKLQGFDVMLKYNSAILGFVALKEGSFMKSFGDTFVAKQEINENLCPNCGRVWFAVAILGKGYANGSGTLLTITFNATAPGESVLDLYSDYPYKPDEVKLTTCSSEAIPNVAIDGRVIVDSDASIDRSIDPPSPDINGDGFVNIQDLAMIGRACGAFVGDRFYDVRVDLDQNGLVDILDIATCARVFGTRVS